MESGGGNSQITDGRRLVIGISGTAFGRGYCGRGHGPARRVHHSVITPVACHQKTATFFFRTKPSTAMWGRLPPAFRI